MKAAFKSYHGTKDTFKGGESQRKSIWGRWLQISSTAYSPQSTGEQIRGCLAKSERPKEPQGSAGGAGNWQLLALWFGGEIFGCGRPHGKEEGEASTPHAPPGEGRRALVVDRPAPEFESSRPLGSAVYHLLLRDI